MKFSQTLRNTVRAVSILAIVFVFFHYTLAQEDIQEIVTQSEELPNTQENQEEITISEVLGDVSSDSEVTQEQSFEVGQNQIETSTEDEIVPSEQVGDQQESPSLFERILDIFTPDEPREEIQSELVSEEIFEEYVEEYVDEIPLINVENLPSISAIPEVKEFTTDVNAVHACWIETFSIDMEFLPNKNNVVMVNHNEAVGPANLEIVGIPPGFDIFFKENKRQTISIPSSQKEVPFTVEKNGETQDGNFSVIFLFTKGVTNPSTTTCQMNIEN